jgi:hypothetical protein
MLCSVITDAMYDDFNSTVAVLDRAVRFVDFLSVIATQWSSCTDVVSRRDVARAALGAIFRNIRWIYLADDPVLVDRVVMLTQDFRLWAEEELGRVESVGVGSGL